VPPAWNTYLAVDSADEVAAAITAAGGQVHVGPMDVADVGRMAYCSDPQGATFGLWQAGTHKGFQKWNEPGSVVWDQLDTDDPDAAARFYSTAFSIGRGEDHGVAVLRVGDQDVASIARTRDDRGGRGWSVLFSVADADAAAAAVVELGGSVLEAPRDFPFGRIGRVADPQGATFGIGSAPGGHG
jgi:uncharacterized protein